MDLEAFRSGRLGEARVVAAAIAAEADISARARIDEATRGASAILDAARAEAAAEAGCEDAGLMVRERARARRIVLTAQRAAYEGLGERVRVAVVALRAESTYSDLLDRLERSAARELGARARIIRDPSGLGGVVAEADGRRVDCTLPVLADRCLRGLGAEVEQLWR